ncbi:MAG: hypothetical protein ACYTFN_22910 [Planctomycetota bacterium]
MTTGTSSGCATSWRFVWTLVALGFLWRVLIAALTVVPSEDGANYLWMAERFAAGDATGALSEVFPPLMPLTLVPPIWLGADPFRAGQVMLALVGALAVLPIIRASEAMLPGSGRAAGCMAVVAHLPVRFAAEVYTEPLFLLIGGLALWAGAIQRWWWLGLLAGLAFWIRPEAALLPMGFVLFRPRAAWRALIVFTLLVLALALWRSTLALGFNLTPVGTFILERTVFAEPDLGAGILRFLAQLLQLPWLWVEAFALVGLLALWGALRRKEPCTRPVLWVWLMVVVMIAAFLPRRRFLVGWMFTVAPLAAMGLATLPRRWHDLLITIIILMGLALSLRVTDPNRIAEREVGQHLSNVMSDGDVVTGDMTRVLYFAGQRPLPPKHFTVEQLTAMAATPTPARFVVLATGKPTAMPVEQRLTDFTRAALPAKIAKLAADRGILVLERKR